MLNETRTDWIRKIVRKSFIQKKVTFRVCPRPSI